MKAKVAQGNSFSAWLASVVLSCTQEEILVLIENPWMSYLWDQPEWLNLLEDSRCAFFTTDFCCWGAPWRKRTRFFTNSSLRSLSFLCRCSSPAMHTRLVGYSKQHRRPWTVAEAYPARLCNCLAMFLSNELLPVERQRRLDIAECAKCNQQIGEASQPGPRPRRPRPELDLEEVQLLSSQTLFIQQRARNLFASWLQSELSSAAWASVSQEPALWAIFLRAFGRHLYMAQQPLYIFRHLVVYYQRNHSSYPGPLSDAWDLIARWERVQPVEHRTPMPKLLFDAMICLAWMWGWKRFAMVSLLAFHGKLRISEPLRACRQDLLLPDDTGAEIQVAFLNIEKSKTSFRGKSIVQHTKVSDDLTLFVASQVVANLHAGDRLYPATPSTYRRRWDRLLQALEVSKSWRLTPGTLRAGGAIHAYHSGTPITEILWLMRLKHLNTLESYLQSVAAMNILLKLPDAVRNRIRSFSSLLPILLRCSP